MCIKYIVTFPNLYPDLDTLSQLSYNADNMNTPVPEAKRSGRRKTDLLETLTTEQAAEQLQISPRTIRRMIERGSIEAHKLDPTAKSVYRIPRAAVERILQERNPTADTRERTPKPANH